MKAVSIICLIALVLQAHQAAARPSFEFRPAPQRRTPFRVIRISPRAVSLPKGPAGSSIVQIVSGSYEMTTQVTIKGSGSATVALKSTCNSKKNNPIFVDFEPNSKSVIVKGTVEVAFKQTISLKSGVVFKNKAKCDVFASVNGVNFRGKRQRIVYKPSAPSGYAN